MDDRQYVTCVLEDAHRLWRPDPFPGSKEASAQGCVCIPEHMQSWPGKLTFATDCAVHPLEKQQEQ